MNTHHVNLPGREYKIDIGLNILNQLLPEAVLRNSTDHVVVVTNTTLHDLYPDRVSQVLQNSGVRVSTCVLADGEEYKNLETLSLIFDFLMKTKNYKFGEAVRALASDAGMQPYRFTKQDEEKQNRWKIYNTILEKYTNFCHEELISEKYPEVNEYLNKRKTSKKEISFFKIGYASSKNDFCERLRKEFDEKQINASGIYYFDENKKKYVDRFRSRIIFPV